MRAEEEKSTKHHSNKCPYYTMMIFCFAIVNFLKILHFLLFLMFWLNELEQSCEKVNNRGRGSGDSSFLKNTRIQGQKSRCKRQKWVESSVKHL